MGLRQFSDENYFSLILLILSCEPDMTLTPTILAPGEARVLSLWVYSFLISNDCKRGDCYQLICRHFIPHLSILKALFPVWQ